MTKETTRRVRINEKDEHEDDIIKRRKGKRWEREGEEGGKAD